MAIIKGSNLADHLSGSILADLISAYWGNDTIGAGDGNDSVYASDGNDWADGGNGDDRMFGEMGNDTLLGGKGNDWLDGGLGADSMRGDAGNDLYVVNDAGDIVLEGVFGGTDEVQTSLGSYTLGTEVENLTYSGMGNFLGAGNGLANVIKGTNAGQNDLRGEGGNDLLQLWNGTGIGLGGTGNDTVLSGSGAAVLGGGDGNDSMDGGAGNDTMAGGAGQDTLIGGTGNDHLGHNLDIHGNGWNIPYTYTIDTRFDTASNDGSVDELRGLSGNDVLWGQAGDKLYGGTGDDTYHIGNGGAFISEEDGGGIDTVVSHGFQHALAADIENLVFDYPVPNSLPFPGTGGGDTPDGGNGIGNALGNVMKGGDLQDTLQGLGGDDDLQGGDGVDSMLGGEGNDTIAAGDSYGEAIGDLGDGGNGNDRLESYGGAHLFGGAGEDQLIAHTTIFSKTFSPTTGTHITWSSSNLHGGDGADTLTSGKGGDHLDGGAGADQIYGGEGKDLLIGGLGQDQMSGGLDADIFRFAATAESGRGAPLRDAILDFERGVDDLDLALIDANATLAGDQAFVLAGKATAFGVWQSVQADDTLLLSADVTGDAVADFQVSIGFGDGLVAAKLAAGDLML